MSFSRIGFKDNDKFMALGTKIPSRTHFVQACDAPKPLDATVQMAHTVSEASSWSPAEPRRTSIHAAVPEHDRDQRQWYHPKRLASDPEAAKSEEQQPDCDEDSHRPAGCHQSGGKEEWREGEHCGQGQTGDDVLGDRTRVPWHARIVPPSWRAVRRSDSWSLAVRRARSHDEIERLPRVRVVVPGDVVQEQSFGAGGDGGASSGGRRIQRTDLRWRRPITINVVTGHYKRSDLNDMEPHELPASRQ
jgi:hypothetical protein